MGSNPIPGTISKEKDINLSLFYFYERRKNWDDDIYEMSDIEHFKFWYSKDTGNQYSQRLYTDAEIDEALSTWNEPVELK